MARGGDTTTQRSDPAGSATDGGPWRRCIASGEVRPQRELLRFVVGPDNTIVPDPAAKMPGRGIWCLPRRDMLEHARRRRRFGRSARANVTVPADLADLAADMLRRRCLDRIGLARRSGDVVAGFAKVRALLAADGAALLLQARDGAPDGRHKLARLAHARCPDLPVLELFTAAEQGGAIGRDDIVHVAIRPGGHAEALGRDCARLAGLMPSNTATDERTQASAGAQ
jgi:hypothetical protein